MEDDYLEELLTAIRLGWVILRRIAGVTVGLLLLQLNLASGASACAEHSGQSSAPFLQGTMVPGAAGTEHHEHEPRDERAPCEIPSPGDCCLAVASCSITFASGSSGAPAEVDVLHLTIESLADRAPAYLIRPPEPPPPKA